MKRPPSAAETVVLAPADRFFLHRVPLDTAATAAGQVALALEELSPFPLAQLYHGYIAGSDRVRALAFACYRRRFAAEEQADWAAADAVLPSIVALLGPPPAKPTVVVHAGDGVLQGVAWDGSDPLPVAFRAQPADGSPARLEELIGELTRAGGLVAPEVRRLTGPIGAERDERGGTIFRIGGAETLRLPAAALTEADVRDKAFLGEKQQRAQRDRRWWNAARAAGALVAVVAGLELAHAGLAFWNGRDRAALAQQAAEAHRIEAAQTMALRIEELSAQRPRPLEWLAAVAAARPRSVQFGRVTGRSDRTLEIQALTANAADVGNFEAALRRLPGVAQVEIRDLRAREGQTSFVVGLAFQPAAPGPGEGQP